MATITLTDKQWEQLKQDMDTKIEMLSDEEVLSIASKLNEQVNIPFIKEGTEETILVKTVKKIDRFLYQETKWITSWLENGQGLQAWKQLILRC